MTGFATALTSRSRIRVATGVSAAATGLLTGQILIIHAANGRDTSLPAAMSWALATVGTWAVVAVPGLIGSERIASTSVSPPGRAARYVALGLALLLGAVTLRALVDPLLPMSARRPLPFAAIWLAFLTRWIGPGFLATVIIALIGHFRATPAASEAAVSEPEPEWLRQLVVRMGTDSVAVEVDTVAAFRASGNYAKLLRDGRWLAARITMTELEARLDPARFLRIHRSAIASLDAIARIHTPRGLGAEVVLRDGTTLPLSRLGRRSLESRLGRRV